MKGTILKKFITQSNFINDGSPADLSTHNTLTHIDLTLCTAKIAVDADWEIETGFFGSDHLPILTNLYNTIRPHKPTHRPLF